LGSDGGEKFDDMYNRFDTVLALDGQRDGQTEMTYQYRHTDLR